MGNEMLRCYIKKNSWDFPGGPVVKTSPSNAGGVGSIPGQGAKMPHTSWPQKQKNIKQKQYCNKFNKDFKKKKRSTSGGKKKKEFLSQKGLGNAKIDKGRLLYVRS